MANLPDETITTVFNLQRRLWELINKTTVTAWAILEQYSETEAAIPALEELDNVRDRLTNPYSRLHILLLRIGEAQPTAPHCYDRATSPNYYTSSSYYRGWGSKYSRNKKRFEFAMTEKAKSPDPAAINRTVARLRETCQQLDALTLLLDDAIAQVEAENRKSPLYAYRLKRAKRLLDSPKPEKLEKVRE